MSEPVALAFLRQLWALDHALHAVSKRMGRSLGVTGPQRLVIRLVGRQPDITPGELARQMHLHPSTLTDILDRLARRRLIERRSDVADRRQTRLSLSAAGRRVDARRAPTIESAIARALAAAPPADIEAAGRIHAALTAALHDLSPKPRTRTSTAAKR